MKIRRPFIAAALAAALLVPVAACSSGSSSSGSTSTTVTSGDQVTDTQCPFTGTVGTTSGGKSSSQSSLGAITTSKQGCVDNIQLKMGSVVGGWSVAYATGPVLDGKGNTVAAQGAATLVVTIESGIWNGTPAVPTTVLPVQLDYVKSINVVNGPGASVLVVFGLSAKKPYQASDSQNPAYISLGIG